MEIRWFYAWIIVLFPFIHGHKTLPSSLRFTRRAYNASIPENSLGKTYVRVDEKMGIFCGDPNLEIRFKIVHGNRDGFFKASEELTGDFWFLLLRTRTNSTDVLNRERKDQYTLTVRATISQKHPKEPLAETETSVFVTVLDTNDLSPLFLSSEYEATVTEDTPLYTSILNVTAEDADLGVNGEIYYSFEEFTEQFAVHPTTGVISLTRPLRYTDKSVHDLTVLARDRGLRRAGKSSRPSSASVRIKVKQVNLYGPEIYVTTLPKVIEQSNANIYAIVRLMDRDEGIHGAIQKLEIIDGDPDGHFRIRPSTKDGVVKKNEYNIEVLRLLDRETAPQGYNLTLRACDKGIPPKKTFKSVAVQLADVNDNAPVFDREEYEAFIPETAPVNSPVIKVKVTDADVGKNAEVLLEIVGGNEGKEFRINSDTGMLYTAVPLDAELRTYYTLTVSALDQGNVGSRKQTAAKIKINIVDANDNDPLFDSPETEILINENEPAGTFVTKVQARDKDSGENSYLSYSLANLNPVPFEIDHFGGIIKTTQLLDYESMRREYTLKIRASDWGLPYRRQTEMLLKIRLRDINDNRPQFEKVDCVGHIPRNIPIGREILTLSAIDFDSGNYISYRIVSGNEDNCFTLDANVGTITVTCDLGDVTANVRELNVTATDSSHFSDTARIRINLISAKKLSENVGKLLNDENGGFECRDTGVARRLTDILAMSEKNNMPVVLKEEFGMTPSRYGDNVHAPELVSFPSEIRVNESLPVGYVLAAIRGRDRDLGYNGKLVYGISSGDDDSVFRIDPETGDLRLIGYLDRERRTEYELNITVYDLGKPQKSVSRLLTVTVLDVNDNAPKFDKNLVNFRITENTPNGTAVYRFNATDADEGKNAEVSYSIVYETREFAINSTSGVLFISAPLDREEQEFYELIVRAVDGANDLSSLHSDALVRIVVEDVNDNAPNFSLPQYTVHTREDIPVGTVVAILTATDPDLHEGGVIRYSMEAEANTDNLFVIDQLTGTVRLTQSLDFEEHQVHTLIVRATDGGSPPLSSETKLVVNVIDVNENFFAPVFENLSESFSVAENQPENTFVARVKATDVDAMNDDSRVGYSIREGDGLGYFSIDGEVWMYSIGSAFFISLAGVGGYFLLPLLTGPYEHHVMNVLIGLSFGSLITSSLCQLIPEAYKLNLTASEYSNTYVAVCSMLGVWITIFIQNLATILGSEDTSPTLNKEQMRLAPIAETESDRTKCHNGGTPIVVPKSSTSATVVDANVRLAVDHNSVACGHSLNNEHARSDTELKPLSNSRLARRCSSYQSVKNRAKLSKLAIIILAGDCMNNFMDGISIGAAYTHHLTMGLKLTAAISFEEYTHKLGDFAIVYQSGISMKRVLFWNYGTSCPCFVGVVIGIALGNLHCSQYIFSFASGLFLYISLSNMIPEMQNMLNDSLVNGRRAALISLLEQHVGFALAFVLLLIISLMLNVGSTHTQ